MNGRGERHIKCICFLDRGLHAALVGVVGNNNDGHPSTKCLTRFLVDRRDRDRLSTENPVIWASTPGSSVVVKRR